MNRGFVLAIIMLECVLITVLNLAVRIQVRASETITIKPDGSIDPPTASISSVDNITYYFTSNVYDEIVVLKDSITVDGAGFFLQGTGLVGIFLDANNITIRNVRIRSFEQGIFLSNSSNNKIHENYIANTNIAIFLWNSSYNNIYQNTITGNNEYGIQLALSSDNRISENNVTNNDTGLALAPSSSNNTILKNNITGNTWGVYLYGGSSNNTLYENAVKNNNLGIWLYYSSNNSISGNNIVGNKGGIWFSSSSNNTISGNNIANNDEGIWPYESSSNKFYHNDFIDNKEQVHSDAPSYVNLWDAGYPSGGNFWSEYAGVDSDSDGIGDTPYVIDANNTDHYPLMVSYLDILPPTICILSPENKTYNIDEIQLTFAVSETTYWVGYSLDSQGNITIATNTTLSGFSDGPHSLIVYAKDVARNTGTSDVINFTIETPQPEPFPMWIALTIVIIGGAGIATLVYLMKIKKTTEKIGN